jgi:hypothetical protein
MSVEDTANPSQVCLFTLNTQSASPDAYTPPGAQNPRNVTVPPSRSATAHSSPGTGSSPARAQGPPTGAHGQCTTPAPPPARPAQPLFPAPHEVEFMTALPLPVYPTLDGKPLRVTRQMMSSTSYYCVSVGFRVGVFDEWDKVKLVTDGCPSNSFKKGSLKECMAMYKSAYDEDRLVEVSFDDKS